MSIPPNLYAFPFSIEGYGCPGMTLRDWFAGQALAGIAAKGVPKFGDGSSPDRVTAFVAYALADAMLAERAKAVS